jgi:BirA family biotin operon repressor/biotin-[acetyl-CoA-carboxylase] ligase
MQPNPAVLLPFLSSGGGFVSGETIARELNLSRVSVHKHLEVLRENGFAFEAVSKKGYALREEPLTFHPVLFQALLLHDPIPFFSDIISHESVTSTNDIAEAELAAGRPAPFLVVATEQTAGRGRRGRVWHSPAQTNLYTSTAIRPSLPPARLQTITLWSGLRICEWIRNTYALPAMIKWPNDIFIRDQKMAGILTEARIDAEMTRDLTIGLGLNVNATANDFPPALQSIATSLRLQLGKPLSLSRVAHQLAKTLANAVQDFLGTDSPDISDTWDTMDYLRGKRIDGNGLQGIASGITRTGSLKIKRDDGSVALMHAGEVNAVH